MKFRFATSIVFCFVTLFLNPIALALNLETDKKGAFILPINYLNLKKISLHFRIPKEFHQINSGNETLEFIPQSESADTRTQIITLQTVNGKNLSAVDFLTKLKAMIKETAKSMTVLEETNDVTKDYQVATLGISYISDGRKEIVYMKYFSGPNDLSGIQYSHEIPSIDFAQQTLDDIKYKINKFSAVVESMP
jgi:hypothetical protein